MKGKFNSAVKSAALKIPHLNSWPLEVRKLYQGKENSVLILGFYVLFLNMHHGPISMIAFLESEQQFLPPQRNKTWLNAFSSRKCSQY